MLSNYNRKSIQSIEFLLKFVSYLGIAPEYDFEFNTLSNHTFEKFYSCFLAITLAGISCFATYHKITNLYQYMLFTQKFFDFTTDAISCVSCVIMILHRSFSHANQWKLMFCQMTQMEQALQAKKRPERNLLKQVNVQLFIVLGFIFALCGLAVYAALTTDSPIQYYHLITLFYFIIDFLLVLVIVNVALTIKCKYQQIIDRLTAQCKNSLITFDVKLVGNYLVSEIKKISYLCLCVNETIRIFNKIFGIQILFISLQTICLLVNMFKLITSYMVYNNSDSYKKEILLDMNTIIYATVFALLSLLKPILIMSCCDHARKIGERIVPLCYKLQEPFEANSLERKEMLSLADQAKKHQMRFSSLDFFEINRSTLFAIFGTTTTYFIVAIQFDDY